MEEVKFLLGESLSSKSMTLNSGTVYVATDEAVLAAGGHKFYGQPTLGYANGVLKLYGVSGETSDKTVELGQVSLTDLTKDRFLESATYVKLTNGVADDKKVYDGETVVDQAGIVAGDALKLVFKTVTYGVDGNDEGTEDDYTTETIYVSIAEMINEEELAAEIEAKATSALTVVKNAVGLASGGTHITTNGNYTSGAATVVGEIAALDTQLKIVSDAVDVLNGNAETSGSVAYAIAQLDAVESGMTEDGFISVKVGEADGVLTAVTVVDSVVEVSAATAENKGLAEASDVKAYVDAAAAKATTKVEHAEDSIHVTVSSATAEDGSVTYTVSEADIQSESAYTEDKKTFITAATVNDVDATVETSASGASMSVTIDGSNIALGGEYTAPTYDETFTAASSNAIASADTLDSVVLKLDNKIKALVDEVVDNDGDISEIATAVGLKVADGAITYSANTADTYISGATSMANADDLLDAALKALADKVAENEITSTGETINITTVSGKTNIEVNIDDVTLEQGTNKKIKVKVDNSEVTEEDGGIKLDDTNANGLTATLYWGTF